MGFHRYSVDARWRIPHFEKMLYDQAQLVLAYLEAGQATGDRRFLDVAGETLAYVFRDLTGPEGAFFSAEDADSVEPGRAVDGDAPKSEGAFYLWTQPELEALLQADAAVTVLRYGVESGTANAVQDPTGEAAGPETSCTRRARWTRLSRLAGQPAGPVRAALGRALDRLREARGRPAAPAPRRQGADGLETA